MKKIFALAAILLIMASSLSAQEMKPAVKAGAKSLNFSFGGLGSFGLGSSGINGGFGASYFTSQDVAFRLGFQASYYRSTTPWNDYTPNGTNPGSDGSTSQFSLGAGVDYLMFVDGISPRVRPYWGPGVSVTSRSSDLKYSVANNAFSGTTLEIKNGSGADGLTVGVSGVLGAEFFLYPELSLSAEYKLTLLSLTSRSDATTITKNNPDVVSKQGSTMQIFGFGAAGATLHIYF